MNRASFWREPITRLWEEYDDRPVVVALAVAAALGLAYGIGWTVRGAEVSPLEARAERTREAVDRAACRARGGRPSVIGCIDRGIFR